MTTNDIDAIRKLTDAATPGPWINGHDHPDDEFHPCEVVISPLLPIVELTKDTAGAVDAEFIAAARTHVPALCDEVEQLRAERSDLIDDVVKLRAELAKVHNQLTAANHRADGLAADVRSLTQGHDAYANENARLRSKLAEADALHQPRINSVGHEWCKACGQFWPCRTRKAIGSELPEVAR